jgi:hypothetical protein
MGVRPLSVRTRLTLWYSAILLGILVVISALSYSVLRWSLYQDLDASLLAVAQVVRDTGYPGESGGASGDPEAALRELLSPDFYDKFFQLLDPEGRPAPPRLRGKALPLSAIARANALSGRRTIETVRPAGQDGCGC